MQEPTSNYDSATPNTATTIFHHQKKPEWGCAILLWDHGEKRGYQFEDGKRRVFKRAYCDFFKPVDRPLDETTAIRKNLLARVGRTPQVVAQTNSKSIPLAAQIELFKDTYSDGFRDDSWAKAKRGSGKKKHLKRHRNPLIARAHELLNRARLDTLISDGGHDDVIAAMHELTATTDLTTKRDAAPLMRVRDASAVELAVALRDVLYGDDEYGLRFERFVAVLGRTIRRTPSWQLATLFPAIVHPAEHLFVKPKTTDVQAEWMAPGLAMTKHPAGPTYKRLRDMAMTLGEHLGEAGLAPKDLLDLHDFMWETLRPKARQLLASKPRLDAKLAS